MGSNSNLNFNQMKQVIIVEDDIYLAQLIQSHINDLSGFTCQHIFSDPTEFLASVIQPDVILLDIIMPEMNGLEAIPKVLEKTPGVSIVMNTIKDDPDTIFKTLQLGAVGYIDKQSFVMNFQEVFSCLENDGAYMTPKIAKKVINFFQRRSGVFDNLTKRESDVAHGILEGLSYKLIADKYDISIDNVRMNVKKIYRKLNINSKAELFKIAQTKI